MSFKLNNITQSDRFFSEIKEKLYKQAHLAAEKSELMRASGPLIALPASALSLSNRVTTIGEIIIKGLGNIFASPFSKKCNALKGLKQLFVQLPLNILFLAFSPLSVSIEAAISSIGMLANPQRYSKLRAKNYSQEIEALSILSKKNFQASSTAEKALVFLLA